MLASTLTKSSDSLGRTGHRPSRDSSSTPIFLTKVIFAKFKHQQVPSNFLDFAHLFLLVYYYIAGGRAQISVGNLIYDGINYSIWVSTKD